MDVLAHSLWTNVMYKLIPETRSRALTTRWGIFFGVFPDIVAFTPAWVYIFYQLFSGNGFRFARPEDGGTIPLDALSHQLYNYSHSLVIWLAVFLLVWIVWKKLPWFLFGWALHIGIDIFSHTSEFYPTPFLYPISEVHVNGKSWGDPVFMIINYISLLLAYVFVIPYLRRKFAK